MQEVTVCSRKRCTDIRRWIEPVSILNTYNRVERNSIMKVFKVLVGFLGEARSTRVSKYNLKWVCAVAMCCCYGNIYAVNKSQEILPETKYKLSGVTYSKQHPEHKNVWGFYVCLSFLGCRFCGAKLLSVFVTRYCEVKSSNRVVGSFVGHWKVC